VFSTTNPSLVPYEMMACGLPVVDLNRPGNEVNYDGRYDIALLADPDPATMARQMAELLDNPSELELRRRNGLEYAASFPTEEEMGARVEQLILARLDLRAAKKPMQLQQIA
jgi:glycosyltransferase involved in cell wall biosynthesis